MHEFVLSGLHSTIAINPLQPIVVLLRRYVLREILHTMVTMMIVLLVIMVSVVFVRYLSDAASGQMTLAAVVTMVGVILPSYLALLIPICFFLAIVLVLGKLFEDSELLVMFACGLSWKQVTLYIVQLGVVLALIVALISLYVMPVMSYHQDNLEQISKQKANALSLVETGRFISLRDGQEVIYIGQSGAHKNNSRDIFIYRQLGKEQQIVLAPKGYMEQATNGQQSLVLENGRVYQGHVDAINWQLAQFKQYKAHVVQPEEISANSDLSAKSTWSLLHHSDTQKQAGFQWRMSLPIATIVVGLLGVAICYIGPRRGRYTKLFNALLIFIIYFNLVALGRSWVAHSVLPSWLGIWIIHIAFMLVALLKIYQLEQGHWPLITHWIRRGNAAA